MLTLPLLLSLVCPQDSVTVQARRERPRRAAITRLLPREQTLGIIELEAPKDCWKHHEQIWQLRTLRDPKMQGFLKWIGSQEPSFGRFLQRGHAIADFLMGMDQGLGLAWVFPPEGRRGPEVVFLGSASDTGWLRQQPRVLRGLLEPDPAKRADTDQREFSVATEVLADSPIMADVLRYKGKVKEAWWERDRDDYLMVARRGRQLTWLLGREYGQNVRNYGPALQVLGSALGFGGGSRGGDRLAGTEPQPEFGEPLGRIVLRWREMIQAEGRVGERARGEMKAVGFDRFVGIRSRFGLADGELRDVIELHHEARPDSAPASPFDVFLPTEGGLAAAASQLPANTVMALRVRLAGEDSRKLIAKFMEFERATPDEQKLMSHYVRLMLGLCPPDAKPGDDVSWSENLGITAFVLPPEAGLTPELFVAVDVGDRKIDAKAILRRLAGDIAREMGRSPDELANKIKEYGRGEDRVPYLKLSDLLSRGGMMGGVEMKLMGGRYLSVARVGTQLIYGMHPRALRKLRKAVDAGETLASREDFQARFPAPTQNPIEFFLDGEGLREAAAPLLGFAQAPFFALFLGVRAVPAGQQPPKQEKLVIPDFEKLVATISDQSLVAERTEFGHRLTVRGCGILSPSIWTVLGFGIDATSSLSGMLPHEQ